jgi:hypothetical protein
VVAIREFGGGALHRRLVGAIVVATAVLVCSAPATGERSTPPASIGAPPSSAQSPAWRSGHSARQVDAVRSSARRETGDAMDAKTACIYTRHSISAMIALQRQLHAPFECAMVYNNAAPTWDGLVSPWFTKHGDPDYQWSKWVQADATSRRLVIGQSLIPTTGMPADWRRRGAAGAYDQHILALSRNLVASGLGHSILRLAHESNGIWSHDNVGRTPSDFAAWRSFWGRYTRLMNSVPGADFAFDWNLNAAYRDLPLEEIYPGDGVVDIVGIDVYDTSGRELPTSRDRRRWNALVSQPAGLAEIVAFATRHSKPISLPEWGLISRSKSGVGDNPAFVEAIAGVVRTNRLAYQAYFNNDLLPGCLAIQKQRLSFSAYRRHFGLGGDSRGRGWRIGQGVAPR